jgi:hypothetical protein
MATVKFSNPGTISTNMPATSERIGCGKDPIFICHLPEISRLYTKNSLRAKIPLLTD